MAFEGSCHCGAVTFHVDADPPVGAMSCNCSHCRRKGFLLAFLPAETFTVTAGADRLTSYFFNKHVIRHRFCAVCGCETHAEGTGPGGVRTTAVNLRCVPSIDLDSLAIEKIDGARF
jgi:hypothetical protein